MKLLHSYENGNTHVKIFSDGTKERTYEGVPLPSQPESIDVKITNYCDGGCSYCHEKSTVKGKHADLNILYNQLSTLSSGVEIAIGGGNPLSHPDLIPFLEKLQDIGIIANMTINEKHIYAFNDTILRLIGRKLIHGVGVSYSDIKHINDIEPIIQATDNVVIHMIMGINEVESVNILREFYSAFNRTCKILVLGYKQFGFGVNYYLKNKGVEDNKYEWYTRLATYFKSKDMIISFDNLAIEQMKLQRFFTDEAWEKFFMGRDFTFSMYIDAVKQEFAPSSTSNQRVSFQDNNLLGFFKTGQAHSSF